MENKNPVGAGVAANVRRLRKEKGLSLAELSEVLGRGGRPLSLKVLSKIENEDRSIDVDDLVALAKALETSTSQLLSPPGDAARQKVLERLEAWQALSEESRELADVVLRMPHRSSRRGALVEKVNSYGAAMARLEELIRIAAESDDDARAALEDYWAARYPDDDQGREMAELFMGGTDGER